MAGHKKETPAPVFMALAALEIFADELDPALWDEATQEKLRKSLPIIAVKRAQAGEEITAESLLADLRQGPEHFHELQRQYGKAVASPKMLTYDDVLEKLRQEDEKRLAAERRQKIEGSFLGALKAGAEEESAAHLERLLAEEGRPNLLQNILDHALGLAAEHGFSSLVENLLAAKANVHAQDDYALRWAAQNRHLAVMDCLLEVGAKESRLSDSQKQQRERYHLWKAVHPSIEPSAWLVAFSPNIVDPKVYTAVQEIMAQEEYKNATGQKYAYHTAALFKTLPRVLEYLERWGKHGKQPLHDVVQNIQIPEGGQPNLAAWGDAVIKHGPAMARYVKFSDRLPEPLKDGSGGWSLTRTKAEIAKYAYKRGAENPELAAFCLDHGWDDEDFDEALKVIEKFRKKYNLTEGQSPVNDNIKGGSIPDIRIEGSLFGKEGYTFYKLPDGDVRGLLLGEFTNCCQHLANAGAPCAKHGFLSEQGGFYVVEEDKSHQIVAQSWAWRGDKGELVFDSLESLSGHFNAERWTSLCNEFSARVKQVAKDAGITAFHVGKGGATPQLPYTKADNAAQPADYKKYRDSHEQYVVERY
ncbi:MAG: ankyrin repeat domain-containing protein [Alphaproteobacteria bacterium]|nr:ankyrin repeat domain-containing protein [Alphaproteobacteria bacterium]